jgi:hypothetical protein
MNRTLCVTDSRVENAMRRIVAFRSAKVRLRPTTTATAPPASARICYRRSATTSAPTPTSAPTNPAANTSTPTGPAAAAPPRVVLTTRDGERCLPIAQAKPRLSWACPYIPFWLERGTGVGILPCPFRRLLQLPRNECGQAA